MIEIFNNIAECDLLNMFKLYIISNDDNPTFKDFSENLKSAFEISTVSYKRIICVSKDRNIIAFCLLFHDKTIQFTKDNSAFFYGLCFEDNAYALHELKAGMKKCMNEILINKIIGPIHESLLFSRAIRLEESEPRFFGMPKNHIYYKLALEKEGFFKEQDLLEAVFTKEDVIEKFNFFKNYFSKRFSHLNIEILNGEEITKRSNEICNFYNHNWTKNWGFQRISEFEINIFCNHLPYKTHTAFMVYDNSKLIGLTIASANIDDPNLESGRAYLIGISEEYRKTGLAAYLLTSHGLLCFDSFKWKSISCSWMLESNKPVLSLINKLGVRNSLRKYRIFTLQ